MARSNECANASRPANLVAAQRQEVNGGVAQRTWKSTHHLGGITVKHCPDGLHSLRHLLDRIQNTGFAVGGHHRNGQDIGTQEQRIKLIEVDISTRGNPDHIHLRLALLMQPFGWLTYRGMLYSRDHDPVPFSRRAFSQTDLAPGCWLRWPQRRRSPLMGRHQRGWQLVRVRLPLLLLVADRSDESKKRCLLQIVNAGIMASATRGSSGADPL